MIITDTHTHSLYSFDGYPESNIGAMCERAIELGLKYLCVTDHYEANYRTLYTDHPVYNAEAAKKDIFENKEKYNVTAYYDKSSDEGGRVRIIVVTEKNR